MASIWWWLATVTLCYLMFQFKYKLLPLLKDAISGGKPANTPHEFTEKCKGFQHAHMCQKLMYTYAFNGNKSGYRYTYNTI